MSNMLGEFRSAHNQKLWEKDLDAYRELAELIWKCEPDYREYIEQCLDDLNPQYRAFKRDMISYNEVYQILYGQREVTDLIWLYKWVRVFEMYVLADRHINTLESINQLVYHMTWGNCIQLKKGLDDRGNPWSDSIQINSEDYSDAVIELPFEVIRIDLAHNNTPRSIDDFLFIDTSNFSFLNLKEIRVPASVFLEYKPWMERFNSFEEGDLGEVKQYPFGLEARDEYRWHSHIKSKQTDLVIEVIYDDVNAVLEELKGSYRALFDDYKKIVVEFDSTLLAFIHGETVGMWREKARKMGVEIRDMKLI